MKTLLTRTASGIVFLAIMFTGILWNQYSFLVLTTLILVGTLNEYFNITAAVRESPKVKVTAKWFVIALSVILYYKAFVLYSPPAEGNPNFQNMFIAFFQALGRLRSNAITMDALLPIAVFFIFAYELFTKSERPFENIGWNLTGVMWVLVPIILTAQLYFAKGGVFLLTVFGIIWLYDSSSYAFGSVLGRTPLFKRISPKKTVEGLAGGFIFTLVTCYFLVKIPGFNNFSGLEWAVLGFIIIVAATFGDLVESLLKRSLNIKDSGSIMPGHGGFLDRFDAYFLTVPFVVFALWMLDQLRNMMLIFEYLNK